MNNRFGRCCFPDHNADDSIRRGFRSHLSDNKYSPGLTEVTGEAIGSLLSTVPLEKLWVPRKQALTAVSQGKADPARDPPAR